MKVKVKREEWQRVMREAFKEMELPKELILEATLTEEDKAEIQFCGEGCDCPDCHNGGGSPKRLCYYCREEMWVEKEIK